MFFFSSGTHFPGRYSTFTRFITHSLTLKLTYEQSVGEVEKMSGVIFWTLFDHSRHHSSWTYSAKHATLQCAFIVSQRQQSFICKHKCRYISLGYWYSSSLQWMNLPCWWVSLHRYDEISCSCDFRLYSKKQLIDRQLSASVVNLSSNDTIHRHIQIRTQLWFVSSARHYSGRPMTRDGTMAVSYTHLTLPTKRIV